MEDPMKTDRIESEWTNNIEIRALGIMRSGNHAILEWIQNQYTSQSTCFLNNVKHGDYDPYLHCAQRVVTGFDTDIEAEDLRRRKKHLLMFSYEDRSHLDATNVSFLESVYSRDFDLSRVRYLGASRRRLDVLIVRDPFNCLASRLRMLEDRGAWGGSKEPRVILESWKAVAREAVRLTRHPKPTALVISYNRWATDEEYRRGLSHTLEGTYTDSSLQKVSTFGGGSSFDEPKLSWRAVIRDWQRLLVPRNWLRLRHFWRRMSAPRPSDMKVFERWKDYAEDETYRRLVSDEEVFLLSDELFGAMPGTRECFLGGRRP